MLRAVPSHVAESRPATTITQRGLPSWTIFRLVHPLRWTSRPDAASAPLTLRKRARSTSFGLASRISETSARARFQSSSVPLDDLARLRGRRRWRIAAECCDRRWLVRAATQRGGDRWRARRR
jgi:hypothetical protein